jgi:octaprenyl-diphosphate synthase
LILALEETGALSPTAASQIVAAGADGHAHSNGEGRRLVAKVLEERGFLSVRPEQITKLVRETGALDRAAKLAREYVARAKECLSELPDTEYRRALLAVPDFILEREN